MQKEDFKKYMGQRVKLVLKPDSFSVIGKIRNVSDDYFLFNILGDVSDSHTLDDCFQDRITWQSGYIALDKVESITPILRNKTNRYSAQAFR